MLISAQDLAKQPDAVIVDCRFNLLDPQAGRTAWQAGHIPGAYYADLDKDLASPVGPMTGRHPLPDREHFAALLGSWGVTPDTTVVAYDNAGGALASRLWWLLRWVGHRHAMLLDGGLQAWEAAGLPLSTEAPVSASGRYPVSEPEVDVIPVDAVEEGLSDKRLTLIDARDAARFAGDAEPIDKVAGHVPGAINRPLSENLDEHGCFKPAQKLRDEFNELLNDRPAEVASMCGSGVTACHNVFAMELAGLPPAALYVGSWSGWISDPARPVAGREDI